MKSTKWSISLCKERAAQEHGLKCSNVGELVVVVLVLLSAALLADAVRCCAVLFGVVLISHLRLHL